MRTFLFSIVASSVLLTTSAFSQPAPTQAAPLAGARQMLLVTTKDWDAVTGVMRRYVRVSPTAQWMDIGEPIPIVVGAHGLGWGKGLNAMPEAKGPVKKEGDGKSPAGIFRLSSAFGLDAEKNKKIKLPYQPLTDLIECVDDVKSTNYNSIVDRSHVGRVDWSSSEKMRSVGAQYRLGVVVDHNMDPREAGGGSCIFVHIWKDDKTGTSGCTAMASEQIDSLVPWLDPASKPVLVQLPEAEYARLKNEWQLP